MEEEIRFHLEAEVRHNLASGMSPEVARREAALAFGGVERFKEAVREARSFPRVEELRQDIGFAVRSLKRTPGLSLLAALALCIGIAANAAVFPAFNTFFLKPLDLEAASELYHVSGVDLSDGVPGARLSWDEFQGIREGASTLAGVGAFTMGEGMVLSGPEESLFLQGSVVSADLFQVLRIPPRVGRFFLLSDENPSSPPAMLISEGLWRRVFGEDPEIVGRTVTLDEVPRTIVGVVPAGREFPERLDLWVPFQPGPSEDVHRRALEVLVRVEEDGGAKAASEELAAVVAGLEERRPEGGYKIRPTLEPLRDMFIQGPKMPVLAMLVLTLMILSVACFNVGTILFIRGADRAEEMAVRSSLGAGRRRIIKQLLVESGVLAVVGGVPGLLLGGIGLRLLMQGVPIEYPGFINFRVDLVAGAWAGGLVLGTAILSGLWPAIYGSRADLYSLLRGKGGKAGPLLRSSTGRKALVGGQISLTLAALIGAGIMFRGQLNSRAVDLGYQPAGLLGGYLELEQGGISSQADQKQFVASLEETLQRNPGISEFTVASRLPIRGQYYTRPFRLGAGRSAGDGLEHTFYNQVGLDYFEVLETDLLAGRRFDLSDGYPSSPPVSIVDQAFAHRHWPGEEAVGKTVEVARPAGPGGGGGWEWTLTEVVGVVETARYLPLVRDPGVVFRPFLQDPGSGVTLVVRTTGDPSAARGALTEAVRGLEPTLAFHWVDSVEEMIHARNWAPGLYAQFFSLMAGFGILLASIGIFGLISHSVFRRGREFGIRMAVGAMPGDLRRLVLKEGGGLLGISIVVGLVAGALFVRGFGSLAPGVAVSDPLVYLVSLAILLCTVALASLPPLLRVQGGRWMELHRTE